MGWAEEFENVAQDAAFWWLGVDDDTYPLEQLGKLSLEVAYKLRTLGILGLLAEGSTLGFRHSCIRAARTRVRYLSRLAAAGVLDDHHKASSRYEPFLDAVAGGDLDVARHIAALSPTQFMQGHEYEDDFCYAQLLHQLVQNVVNESALAPLLARFDTYLAGEENPRWGVCKALCERDQGLFDEQFIAFLELFESDALRQIEIGVLEDVHVLAQREVCVEGLALLGLAELRGLSTASEYAHCPSLARLPVPPCPVP